MGRSPPRPAPADPFRLLVDAHRSYVARRARSAGAPKRDVPDVVQKVFLALHEAMGRGLDVSGPLRPWLRTVTYRTVRDHIKLTANEREELSVMGRIEDVDAAPTPEQRMQEIDTNRLVDGVLDMLRPERRLVLVMSDIEEMPMSEIAAVLEIPIGTGYTRLRAARRDFEAAWNARRASGHAAVLPFVLWGAGDLLRAARPIPDLPPETMDEMWRHLVAAIGPGLVGVAGAAGGAAAASTAKAGAVVTAKQAAIGAVAAVLLGAGLHAALRSAVAPAPTPAPVVLAVREATTATPAPAVSVMTSATSTTTTPSPPPRTSASAATTTKAAAGAADADASERAWLTTARDEIDRRNFAAARAALAHVRSPHFAEEREQLRRLVLAYQDGGP